MFNKIAISVLTVWYLFILTKPAYAYLDPGTGSMILQLFLGGLAGLAVILKLYLHRILALFGITKDEEK